jgi:hypothetical protein
VSTKTIVLLGLVVVAFVVILIVGNAQDDGDSTETPWWGRALDNITGALMPPHPVTARDAFGSCIDGGGIAVRLGTTCAFSIRTADVRVRELQLKLVGGQKSNVVVELKGDVAMKVTFPLRSEFDKSPKVKVLRDGASVAITCEVSIDPTFLCRFQFVQ